MHPTSLSLLTRAGQLDDAQAWSDLVALYRPLLESWLRRYDVQPADVDDVVQEVLAAVARELPSFQHNERVGAFRNWLRTMLVFRLKDYWRKKQHRPQPVGGSEFAAQLHELEDETSGTSRLWNQEHDAYLMQRLSRAVRQRFDAKTWEAFERQVLRDEKAADVAAELGISLSSVYAAKSRVLHALRQQSQGLVGEG